MRLFWDIAIEPLLAAVRPARIVEIGVDRGLTTERLVAFAESRGAFLEAIDPEPKIDTQVWEREHPDTVRFHRGLSVEVLPGLEPAAAVLIDGDHNWYTVRNELTLLERVALEHETTPPVVMLHDTGWPYAHRDLYYAPATIPPEGLQPHARRGLMLGKAKLVADGFNDHLEHALREHGPRNGVRRAVDDFMADSDTAWNLTIVPGCHGLGVLVPAPVLEENARLRDAVTRLGQSEFLTELVELLERSRIETETRRQQAGRRLAAATADRDALRERVDELGARTRELDRFDEEHRLRTGLEQDLLATARAKAEAEGMLSARDRELEIVVAALEEARGAAAAAVDRAIAASAQLDETVTTSRREARKLADASAAAEQRAQMLERSALEQEHDAQEARRALHEAEREQGEVEQQLAERDRQIEDLTAANARLAADLDDSHETLQSALEEARADAGRARVAARELREQLELREIEIGGRDEEVRLLRQSLAEARADAEIAIAQRIGLESQMAALTAEHHAALARATLQRRPALAAQSPPPAAGPPPPMPPPRAAALPPAVAPLAPTPPTRAVSPPLPMPPARAAVLAREPSEPERQAQDQFLREYPDPPAAPGAPDVVDSIALPSVRDLRGVLVETHDPAQATPTVDVIVCIHDALDDVRLCLWSILDKTDQPIRLVLVNDGSGEATTAYLRSLVADEPAIQLVENLEPPHGYTIAANLGLRAATGDYLVLLNSDTIVTRGWIDRIVECGESDASIGILGPLSNAASHQSVPELRDKIGWATNPLPRFATPDVLATLLTRISSWPRRPRVPFINGFCFVIKRAVIDAIGYFDEEHFASGYCEENDYCVRAGDAGFELAIAEDAYVFHSKSKSFSPQGRQVLAKRNYQIFVEKHGRERIDSMVQSVETNTALAPLRAWIGDALASGHSLAAALDVARVEPLRIVFVLPGLGVGGSGGSHSIYQEVTGLRALGLDATIALNASAMQRARGTYDDVDELFRPYRDVDELAEVTADADVISATHFKSASLVAELRERRDDFIPAYYIQDYEPFFTARNSADIREALASYTLIPDCLLFAKTHWLCNIVTQRHSVQVAKVEPSIDEQLYRESGMRAGSASLRIAAMIRPRTPRRQPTATVAALEALSSALGPGVHITTFGCPREELERFTGQDAILRHHRGILSRAQVAELLGATDVFLDLSMYQAFGRTALEAMACGATAVVPRLGGVWEFVEHRENAIAIDAFDPQQAVDALSELAADRKLLEGLQSRALATASRYSIMRASLSEYLLFTAERRRRAGASQSDGVLKRRVS